MKLSDMVLYSLKSLRHRKMRSWLTILGIVIGIASVVSLINMGEGLNRAVEKELAVFGFNTLYVLPYEESQLQSGGFSSSALPPSAGKLRESDYMRLKKIAEITEISREIERKASVEFKDKKVTSTINGIEPGIYEKMTAIELAEGRFMTDSDRHVAVIGDAVTTETFKPRTVGLGSYLVLNNTKYRVVGVLKKSTSSFGAAMDGMILVPFEDARGLFRGSMGSDEMDAISMMVAEGADVEEVAEKVRMEMDAAHKVGPDERDYSVMSMKTIQEAIGSVLSLITLFLGAVAAISLVVGALSIGNSMFTSVMERTHEIGVLKAVGASEDDILRIFIFESCAVGAAGGLIGSLIGMALMVVVSFLGLPAAPNPMLVLFGTLFAAFIGLASGYVPARMAAKLSPVDALRYE